MKPLGEFTLCIPYYRNPRMLREQMRIWREYPAGVQIIVVDDGSPEDAYSQIDEHADEVLRDRISLYRVDVDLNWNRGGARNLSSQQATTPWLCHLDIDHVLPADCARRLLKFTPDPRHWYRFTRFRNGAADETRRKDLIPPSQTYGKIKPHIDGYLCTKHMYWKAGGYNEDFTGCLGGGSPFLAELAKQGSVLMAPEDIALEVYTRSKIADASDMSLSRDRTEYARRKAAMKGKVAGKNPIRFPWHKVEL